MVGILSMAEESMAARLTRLRKEQGLSKYRLAKLSGKSETYIYRLEAGEVNNPRRDTLTALARGLNIPVSELVGESPTENDPVRAFILYEYPALGEEEKSWLLHSINVIRERVRDKGKYKESGD